MGAITGQGILHPSANPTQADNPRGDDMTAGTAVIVKDGRDEFIGHVVEVRSDGKVAFKVETVTAKRIRHWVGETLLADPKNVRVIGQ